MRPRRQERPGHFVCADQCRWFIHHHVGKWCVSSIGDFRSGDRPGAPAEIGYRRLYETMVFDTSRSEGRGRWSEVAVHGYMDVDAAEKGHFEMLRKYTAYAKRAKARKETK